MLTEQDHFLLYKVQQKCLYDVRWKFYVEITAGFNSFSAN